MEWVRRLKAAVSIFLATLITTHQVEAARFKPGEDEGEQPHTHEESLEPEETDHEDDDEGGPKIKAFPRTRTLVVTCKTTTLVQGISHNLGLLDQGTEVTPDFQVILREEHPAGLKKRDREQVASFIKTKFGDIGNLEFGSRVRVEFIGLSAGTTLFVPIDVPLTATIPGLPGGFDPGNLTGRLTLVESDGDENSFKDKYYAGAVKRGLACVPRDTDHGSHSGFVTYEVVDCDPAVIETAVINVYVAFVSDVENHLPGIGQSMVMAYFMASYGPLDFFPRADPNRKFQDAYTILPSSTTLLFPFVTNQAGIDTGITIANTSLDPFGTPAEYGIVTLYYYGRTTGGGKAPAPQTSFVLAPGSQLVMTLSNGGNCGIAATPGFQGYIIAVATFRHCFGVAFISPLGAQHGPGWSYRAEEIDRNSASLSMEEMKEFHRKTGISFPSVNLDLTAHGGGTPDSQVDPLAADRPGLDSSSASAV